MTATLAAPARAVFLAPALPASVPALRAEVTARLTAWGLDLGLIADVALALTEMLTNALTHGGAEELDLRLTLDHGRLLVEVDDQFLYPPYPVRQCALEPGDPDLGLVDTDGRGVFLVEMLADAWGCRIVRDDPARGVVGVKTVFAEFSV